MNGGDFPAPELVRKLESVLGDANGRGAGDDLDTGNDVGNHLMLDAGVQVLGVFAENHHVDGDIREARGNAGQRMNRAHVGVKIQTLAKGDIDAGEAASDGGSDRAFKADPGAVQAIDNDRRPAWA